MRNLRAGPAGEGLYSVLIPELIHSLFVPLYPDLSLLLPVETELKTEYINQSPAPVHEEIRRYL